MTKNIAWNGYEAEAIGSRRTVFSVRRTYPGGAERLQVQASRTVKRDLVITDTAHRGAGGVCLNIFTRHEM